MSDLATRLMDDIKTAMKGGDKEALLTLRSLHASLKDATVNVGKDITDDAFIAVVAKAIKQRQDAAAQFRAAARNDLANKEDQEIALLQRYQPRQLTEAELIPLIEAAIAETGAASKKEMGKVMAALMPRTKGKADGALVSRLVGARLP
ncbi:MAG TPA: GatB/YqeY domain-containing protein [Kiritimatiellia bacterium]|nr:GatB/YqeY domain-containing protein [Kiritimatiellia bacterium]